MEECIETLGDSSFLYSFEDDPDSTSSYKMVKELAVSRSFGLCNTTAALILGFRPSINLPVRNAMLTLGS